MTVTAASPQGYGICEKEFPENTVQQVGRWHERWRYKRTPVEARAPRRRALGDPLVDLHTAARNPEAFEQSDNYGRNESFRGGACSVAPHPEGYRVAKSGRCKYTREHITLKEAPHSDLSSSANRSDIEESWKEAFTVG